MRFAAILLLCLVAGVALLVFGGDIIRFNAAPFAKIAIAAFDEKKVSEPPHGEERFLNTRALDLAWSDPTALTDSLYEPTHQFQFPHEPNLIARLIFPFPMEIHSTQVLGNSDQKKRMLTVGRLLGREDVQVEAAREWLAKEGVPPIFRTRNGPMSTDEVRVFSWTVSESDPPPLLVLNSIHCAVQLQRWKGIALFLTATVVFPWLVGIVQLLSILGAGTLVVNRLRDPGADLAYRLVCGIVAMTTFACIWLVMPRHIFVDIVWCAAVCSLAVRQLFALFSRRNEYAENQNRFVIAMMAFVSLLLLASSVADSYGIGTHRIQPLDFLQSYYGAECLSRNLGMPVELANRPWLVHAMFAPWDRITERFSYFAYLGFLSGLNAAIIIPAVLWMRRWSGNLGMPACAFFLLMPAICSYHFLGQRPFSAGLAFIGIYWLTNVDGSRRLIAAGIAFLLAIGAHPSAAFFLGVLILWSVIWGKREVGFSKCIGCLGIPVLGYAAWLFAMRILYPGRENALLYYPFSLDWNPPGEPGMSLLQRLGSISSETWQTLVTNRLRHLRHYFWTDNLGGGDAAIFRWISLPNILGFFGCLMLLRKTVWQRDKVWSLMIIASLIIHHLYIGQANPQFHISPIPFLAIAMLVAAEARSLPRNLLNCLLQFVILLEWFCRNLWPAWIAVQQSRQNTDSLSTMRQFGDDSTAYIMIACVPAFVWMLGAVWFLRKADDSNG